MSRTMKQLFLTFLLWLAPTAWSAEAPSWAKPYIDQIAAETPPEDAKIWRVLDQMVIKLRNDGKFDQTRRIVQVITAESGAEEGSYFMLSGYERGVKIKKLKGWHLRPGGRVTLLEKDNIATGGLSDSDQITTGTITIAALEGVTKSSIVIFETREILETFFSQTVFSILSEITTKKFIIELEAGSGKQIVLNPVNLEAWGLKAEMDGNRLIINDLPGFEDEILAPDFLDPFPYVIAGFSDGAGDRLASWDNMAKWYLDLFHKSSGQQGSGAPVTDVAALRKQLAWFDEKITYRQRYLSAMRGWTPAAGAETSRRAYGDCKDMVACLAWRCSEQGMAVAPVMANIGGGSLLDEHSPVRAGFNHLIAAIELGQTMNLPAEVEAGGKRYLIYDPTSKYTPFGHLPAEFYGRKVMICTEAGAQWVTIPESALEVAESELMLRGQLDAQFTLSGTFELLETGNDLFLRTAYRNGNDRDLMRVFRATFEIPGVVDLELVSSEIDAQQRLKLVFKVNWPSFFRRDAGGLRLPTAMIGYRLRNLDLPGRERKSPIYIARRTPIKRVLDITSEIALKPGLEQALTATDHDYYQWQASGGNNLKMTFVKKSDQIWFPGDKLSEGLEYWTTWRKDFNSFWTEATLYYPQ